MSDTAFFFLMMVLAALVVQGFFAMLEMAAVSINKVRLQYYVSQKDKRAIWLSRLLHQPALLFGTTLIGTNAALMIGSECARRFYDALGLSPDWAALSQVLLVLVFAELSPLFAGRRYAEHTARLGAAPLFFFSLLFRPLVWALDLLCRGFTRLVGKPVVSGSYLSREELQGLISERDETLGSHAAAQVLSQAVSNIFSLKSKCAKDLMEPLTHVKIVPSFCTVGDLRELLKDKPLSFLPIYHRQMQHIVGVAYPRDLLRLSDNKRVKEYAKQPWFITENSSILHILKQFRRNNQRLAIVLSEKGVATGVLTLDEIINEVFGRSDEWVAYKGLAPRSSHVFIDRSFPSDMQLSEFNQQFGFELSYEGAQTLEEIMLKILGHTPAKGESVRVEQFELTVEEASLLGPTQIQVRTLS